MRHLQIASLLLTICCLAGRSGLAQRAAVAPLVPRAPAVLPPVPVVDVLGAPPARSSAPPATVAAVPRPAVVVPGPLFILNSSVIIDNDLAGINPDEIQQLRVYKGPSAPPGAWRSLTTYGIIDITPKKKGRAQVKSRTLAEIGQLFGAPAPVRYSINGMPVSEASIRVANASIGEVKLTRAATPGAVTWVDIQITHRTPPPPAPDPSGKPRIMIRGTASL